MFFGSHCEHGLRWTWNVLEMPPTSSETQHTLLLGASSAPVPFTRLSVSVSIQPHVPMSPAADPPGCIFGPPQYQRVGYSLEPFPAEEGFLLDSLPLQRGSRTLGALSSLLALALF